MDLFWLDRVAGTMCNHKMAGCLIKEPVLCSEARSSAPAKSVATAAPAPIKAKPKASTTAKPVVAATAASAKFVVAATSASARPVFATSTVTTKPAIAASTVTANPVFAATPVTAKPVVATTAAAANPVVAATPVTTKPVIGATSAAPSETVVASVAATTSEAPVHRGILNVKASCYFNSVVQALAHIPELRQFVSAREPQYSLERRLRALWDEMSTAGTRSVDPRPLMREFADIYGDFEPEVSSDAAMVVRALVESFEYTRLFDFEITETRPCDYCQAENESPSVERVQQVYFPLAVRESATPVALSTLLEAHFGGRVLTDLRCRVCGFQNNVATRVTRLSPSPLLVLAFSRFKPDGSKLETPVLIPMELDMSLFAPIERGTTNYELVSIVHHSGGHFVTEYKEGDEWFRADDSEVNSIGHPNLSGATPYIVVYRAQNV